MIEHLFSFHTTFLILFLHLSQKKQKNHKRKRISLKPDTVCGKYFHNGSVLTDSRTLSLPPGQTGCGAHPANYNMGTMIPSPENKTAMA